MQFTEFQQFSILGKAQFGSGDLIGDHTHRLKGCNFFYAPSPFGQICNPSVAEYQGL